MVLGCSVALVIIIILVLIVALVQQHRFYRDKKRTRALDRYEANLRDLPFGNIEPRAPTETTSLWNERQELPGEFL